MKISIFKNLMLRLSNSMRINTEFLPIVERERVCLLNCLKLNKFFNSIKNISRANIVAFADENPAWAGCGALFFV